MDPNACLKKLLELCEEFRVAQDAVDVTGETPPMGQSEYLAHLHEQMDRGDEIVEAFTNLHEWLQKGGFVPSAWAKEETGLGK